MNKQLLIFAGAAAAAFGVSFVERMRSEKNKLERVQEHQDLVWDDEENFSSTSTSDGIVLIAYKKGSFWYVEATRGVDSVKSTKYPSLAVAKKSSFAFAEHIRFPPVINTDRPFKVNL